MPVHSAALLPFRITDEGAIEVFIAHMGGPFFAHKDAGAWSVVKGEFDPRIEDSLEAAHREFTEEVGAPPPAGDLVKLADVTLRHGKIVTTHAVQTAEPVEFVESNTFEMEWPRGSGKIASFPEMDGGRWMTLDEARAKIANGQQPIFDYLADHLSHDD